MTELEKLKRDLGRVERGRGRRYPAALRERAVRYARSRRDEGASWATIGEELTVRWETLRRWCMDVEPPSAMVPVEVFSTSPLPQSEVAVVSPTGWRLEGIDVREAVAVLRALS